jgi:hypothetical protein
MTGIFPPFPQSIIDGVFPMRGVASGVLRQGADKVVPGGGERGPAVRHLGNAFVLALPLHTNFDLRDNAAGQNS